jgi:hypothetical protein
MYSVQLKLRQMGTYGVQIKRGPFLVGSWLKEISFPALAALVSPVQNTLFHFMCPHCPATKAGSRSGSPVSLFVSLRIRYPDYRYAFMRYFSFFLFQ